MPALLVMFCGRKLLRSALVGTAPVNIGSGTSAHIRLDGPEVARLHAKIVFVNDRYEVIDISDGAGLKVNGSPAKRKELSQGDAIDLGPYTIHFDGSAPQSVPAPVPRPDRAQEASQRLETLFSVCSEFSSLVSQAALLERMLDCLLDVFGAERGFILLASGKAGELKPVVTRKIESSSSTETISRTVARRVAQTRAPLLVNDLDSVQGLKNVQSIQAAEILSVICSPLVRDDQLVGVVYLDSQLRTRRFGEEDLKVLETFSHHASHLIANAAEKDRLRRDVTTLRAIQRTSPENVNDLAAIIGSSQPIQKVVQQARQVAQRDVTTLILGPSGCGKELLARGIHGASSRKDGPFVAINCMALSREVIESELFGHEKGSYTGAEERRIGRFELASSGTLFLDEIGELSREIQVKLLRVLQERAIERVGSSSPIEIDVRLIAATNQDLEKLVSLGQFRQDLYYRLNVITLKLPTLAERRDDIPLLVDHFVRLFNRQTGRRVRGATAEALAALTAYAWPGNIRELRNIIERCFVLETQDEITLDSLPLELLEGPAPGTPAGATAPAAPSLRLPEAEAQLSRTLILGALQRSHGRITTAAEELGLSRKSLYRRLASLGITTDQIDEARDTIDPQALLDELERHGGNVAAVARGLRVSRATIYRKLKSLDRGSRQPAPDEPSGADPSP